MDTVMYIKNQGNTKQWQDISNETFGSSMTNNHSSCKLEWRYINQSSGEDAEGKMLGAKSYGLA